MSNLFAANTDPNEPMIYQIRLKGHLGQQWADWFGGLTISLEDSGDTLLSCPVADQAALHGLLKKVRDLGMPLLPVKSTTPGENQMTSRSAQPSPQIYARLAALLYLTEG